LLPNRYLNILDKRGYEDIDLVTSKATTIKGDEMNKKYTVWVGGSEVQSYWLTDYEAKELKQIWDAKGYDDVVIEEMETVK
jgi:hypothetical protein